MPGASFPPHNCLFYWNTDHIWKSLSNQLSPIPLLLWWEPEHETQQSALLSRASDSSWLGNMISGRLGCGAGSDVFLLFFSSFASGFGSSRCSLQLRTVFLAPTSSYPWRRSKHWHGSWSREQFKEDQRQVTCCSLKSDCHVTLLSSWHRYILPTSK